jgi:hypothetical protein
VVNDRLPGSCSREDWLRHADCGAVRVPTLRPSSKYECRLFDRLVQYGGEIATLPVGD